MSEGEWIHLREMQIFLINVLSHVSLEANPLVFETTKGNVWKSCLFWERLQSLQVCKSLVGGPGDIHVDSNWLNFVTLRAKLTLKKAGSIQTLLHELTKIVKITFKVGNWTTHYYTLCIWRDLKVSVMFVRSFDRTFLRPSVSSSTFMSKFCVNVLEVAFPIPLMDYWHVSIRRSKDLFHYSPLFSWHLGQGHRLQS